MASGQLLLIYVLLLLVANAVNHPRKAELDLIKDSQPHFSLDSLVLGKSKRRDFLGNHYYYFVFQKWADQYVSDAMQRNGGEWEGFLNRLLEYQVTQETTSGKSPRTLVVVDVGANLGSFTLFAASLGCNVRAFEMQPLVYTVLEMGIRLSGYQKHCHLFNEAIWNSTREVTFTPTKKNFGNTWIDSRTEKGGGEVKMTSKRLDEVISDANIFFLKLDVEGVEEWALRGFDSYINAKRVKHIAIGDSGLFHAALYKWLYAVGYSCRNYGPVSSSNLPLQDCEKHDAFPASCIWKTFHDLETALARITNGHLNVFCTLQTPTSS